MLPEDYTRRYLAEVRLIADQLDVERVDRLLNHLANVRQSQGRVFVIGIGGGAGNASHAAADLRTLADIEAYAPTDNASGVTALINDRGWEESLSVWLDQSRLSDRDALLVMSVGGGSLNPPVSVNIINAVNHARQRGAAVLGIVGRDGGAVAQLGDACVIVPTINEDTITPHTESFQAVIWHLAVTHPLLNRAPGRWESLTMDGSAR